ncbi:MAG: PIN domain protein, partial [Pseudomonadota bacterium]
IEDAQHIALATIHSMDILLSWNFKHLANVSKQTKVKLINEHEGYVYPLMLTNPMKVMYENE